MMQVSASRTISMGHRLRDYKGICSSLHGHNVRVEVCIDPMNEFADFKDVDRNLEGILQPFDHAMVLHEEDGLLTVLKEYGAMVDGDFRLVALSVDPTTENIAHYIFQELTTHYLSVRFVKVYETDKYSATAHEMAKPAIRARFYV